MSAFFWLGWRTAITRTQTDGAIASQVISTSGEACEHMSASSQTGNL